MQPETQQACRERIHWMCSQATGNDVLDVGCSQGIASLLLGKEGYKVLGLDIDADTIDYACRALAEQPSSVQENVTFKRIEPGALPVGDESFDTVLLGEILEHLACPAKMLSEVRRVLRPKGKVIITVPFGVHPQPDHLQTFYLSHLTELLEDGFQIDGLFIAHKYIHCTAVKNGGGQENRSHGRSAELLDASEQAFFEAEKNHWKMRDRQKARINKLQEQLEQQDSLLSASAADLRRVIQDCLCDQRDGLSVENRLIAWQEQQPSRDKVAEVLDKLHYTRERFRAAGDFKSKLAVFDDFVRAYQEALACCEDLQKASHKREKDWLQSEVRRLKSGLSRQSEQLDYYKDECQRKFEEVRYQLGDALVSACSNPRDLFLLPGRLVRLFFSGLSRRRQRKHYERHEQQQIAQRGVSQPRKNPNAASSLQVKQREIVDGVFRAADGVELYPVQRPQRPSRTNIKAAVILDEFTTECFHDEFHMIPVTPENWKEVLRAERPDFLFVESAWKGNGMAWRHMVSRARQMNGEPLVPMVEWCKQHDIPTVFWNKEDPPNFEHFIYAASHFDYIFTTDEDCIPDYREHVGHDRIMALPFAAQPSIHNPIGTSIDRPGKVCFAGTWYNRKHSERRVDMEMLLNPALSRGLHIYDRMHHHQVDDAYRWPEKYQPAIQGSLPYEYTIDAYKKYEIFLNVNSVKYSPTMYSRRVLELLACGTPVISTYSLGIEKMLGRECVALIESEKEVADWLDRLLGEPELRERMALLGQRRIFSEHTYARRFATIAEQIGITNIQPRFPVSVIGVAKDPAELKDLLEQFQRQSWPDRELLCIYRGSANLPTDIENEISETGAIRLLRPEQDAGSVQLLNRTIGESKLDYIAFFDPDAFYGEHYLRDLILAFTYAEADAVGKATHFSWDFSEKRLSVSNKVAQHRYVEALPLSAMITRREVFDRLMLEEHDLHDACRFSRRCKEKGLRLYSADRFNFADITGKTGVFSSSEPDKNQRRLLASIDEYQTRITV
jgi:spore maturation protein CgeB/2-polyprenyl-3-methyl-5-hydroxy-6-metoxy-1,4-benzoquinol methylase